MNYGERLGQLIESKGLTRQEVARRIGVEQGHISNWERSPLPPLDGIIKYLEAIGRDLSDLFGQAYLSQEEQDILRMYNRAPEGVKMGIREILKSFQK